MVVNPQVPAKTLPELVQLIRDNPGKYGFAGPGIGSTPHLGGELFRLATHPRELIEAFGPFAYIGLFSVIFAETGLFVGFFLPGDSLLFTAPTYYYYMTLVKG